VVRLEAHYGATVTLDACLGCHALWADERETLRLTPGATLQLFEVIHGSGASGRRPLDGRLVCPRCGLRLIETHDRQRDTPFRYWRCARHHGRFITFFDFLREKQFVRPLTAPQVAELRQQVRSVNCSNCGAPIDLRAASMCAYCRTALSMLDFAQVERMLKSLGTAERTRAEKVSPDVLLATLPLALARERRQVEAFFSQVEQRPQWSAWSSAPGLVEAGVSAVMGLLKALR
jgi:hypothetical protein